MTESKYFGFLHHVGMRAISLYRPLDAVLTCEIDMTKIPSLKDKVYFIEPVFLTVRMWPMVRLMYGSGLGGQSQRGILQIRAPPPTWKSAAKADHRWLAVCADNFNNASAAVVCRYCVVQCVFNVGLLLEHLQTILFADNWVLGLAKLYPAICFPWITTSCPNM